MTFWSRDQLRLPPPANRPPFITREAKAAEVLSHLASDTTSGLVALHGPAGFGKTRLLDGLCHDPVVRDHFPDGILKVELRSPTPAELRETVLDACYRISGQRPPILTLPQAGEHLGTLLSGLQVLIFLDDVWNASDLEPFLGGDMCGRVMTTRDVLAIPPGWIPVQIDAMTDSEAFALLRYGLEDHISSYEDVVDLLSRSGRWPLLLRLLNGLLRDDILRLGRSAADALAFVRRFLQEGAPAMDQQISAAIEESLGRLEGSVNPGALERFRKLAIFPEEVQIPVDPVLPLVWARPDFSVELEIRRFAQLSLIESFDPEASTVRLHTVIRDYLRIRNKHQLPIWNQQLLDSYRSYLSEGRTWYGLPIDHKYLWQNLAFHLREAGLSAELVSTVTDLRYLSKRAYEFGPAAADTDLRHGQACRPGDELIYILQAVFRGSPRRLSGFRRPSDLAATLAAQLHGVSASFGLITQLLSSLEPPYLRVEWMAGEKPHAVLGWHDGQPVNAVACDAAGTRAASAGADGAVRIWDMTPGVTEPFVEVLQCHSGPVNSLSFDGAGTRLATAGADGTVCVFALSADQIRLATVLRGHAAEVNAATFDGPGVRVASAGADGTIRIWRRQDENDYPEEAVLPGRHRFVNAVSFDPMGTLLAAGAADGWVSVWRFEDGGWREVWARQAHHPDPVNSVSFDRLGTLVVSAGADGTVQLLDAISGDEKRRWLAHDGTAVLSVKFDGLGSRVVSGGADGSIRIWDADSTRLVAASDLSGSFVKSVACDDSGTKVVSGGSDGAVRVFAPVTLDPIANEWADMIKSVSVSPHGDRLAAGRRDGAIRILDVSSGEERAVLEGHGPFVNSVAWDASGERIVSAGADGSVRIWDAMSGHERLRLQRPGPPNGDAPEVNAARFDHSGERVVSGGADGVVRIWDARSGEQVSTLVEHGTPSADDGQVNAVSFDPSGTKVLSAGADGILRIWDLRSGQESGQLVGHIRWVHRACFDAEGKRVVSGAYDGDARLWDVATREERHTLATANWVAFADFDPAGRWVAVGDGGGAVQIWDFRSDALLTELRLDCSIFDGACGPDGTIAVGTGYGVYLLRLVSSLDG